jgi:hypothetical protein
MIIKRFEKFESLDFSEFPNLDEVKTYFYDLFDESEHRINLFDAGYKFFLKPHRVGENYEDILKDKSNFIDIINSDLPDKRLSYSANFASINLPKRHAGNEIALKSIKNGATAYKHIMINFLIPGDYYHSLFSEIEINILLDCLITFYNHTGFRCYGDLWSEDYAISPFDNGVITKYGFSGLFINCEDNIYKKISDLNNQHSNNEIIQKYFL